jgi:hypothetical protein
MPGYRSTTFQPVSQLPPVAERRRRLVTRTLPLALVAIVAFVVGAAAGAPGSPEKDAADRFAEAWAADEFAAMYKELNPASKAKIGVNDFTTAYREAEQVATLRALEPGSAHDPDSREGETLVPVPIALTTVAFGRFEEGLELPYDDGGIDWNPSLVFPGLRDGERLETQI